jgi:hypothetical protein
LIVTGLGSSFLATLARMRTRTCAGVVLACVATLVGCASQSGRHDASDVAERFLAAASSGDAEAACALMTPQTRADLATADGSCARSLPADRLGGAVTDADTWSDWARVNTDDGTLFLTEFESGWLVDAAGCEPNGDAPYRCVVGG